MKLPRLILMALFILTVQTARAQFQMSLDLGSGYGINPELIVLEEEVEGRNGFVNEVYYNLHFPIKKFQIDAGIGGMYILNHGFLFEENFRTSTLRLTAKLHLSYRLNSKWRLGLGVSGRNNRDFNEIYQFEPFNYRYGAEVLGQYQLNPRMGVYAKVYSSFQNYTAAYFINDPRFGIICGLNFNLFTANKDE